MAERYRKNSMTNEDIENFNIPIYKYKEFINEKKHQVNEQSLKDTKMYMYLFVMWYVEKYNKKGFYKYSAQNIKKSEVNQYCLYLSKLGYNKASIKKSLSAPKTYMTYLRNMYDIENDAFNNPVIPKVNKPVEEKVHMTVNESDILWESTKDMDVRTRCVIGLGLFMGIRRQEMVSIKIEDIDIEAKTIHIEGKGNKHINMVIPNRIIDDIEEMYRYRKGLGHKYLIQSDTNSYLQKPMNFSSIKNIVDKAMAKANLNFTTHDLRRAYGVRLLSLGYDIVKISKAMRHTNIATTARYLNINYDDIKNDLADI